MRRTSHIVQLFCHSLVSFMNFQQLVDAVSRIYWPHLCQLEVDIMEFLDVSPADILDKILQKGTLDLLVRGRPHIKKVIIWSSLDFHRIKGSTEHRYLYDTLTRLGRADLSVFDAYHRSLVIEDENFFSFRLNESQEWTMDWEI